MECMASFRLPMRVICLTAWPVGSIDQKRQSRWYGTQQKDKTDGQSWLGATEPPTTLHKNYWMNPVTLGGRKNSSKFVKDLK